jgi:hypothetical protein
VLISGILFPYGQEVMEAALAAGQAISYRCVRQDGVWYVHATTERPEVERVTCRQAGALGVNLIPDRVTVGEVDRFGTPVPSGTSPSRCRAGQVQGRRKQQVLASLGDVVADLVAWAPGSGKPVVEERLDFLAKKGGCGKCRVATPGHCRTVRMPPSAPCWCRGRPGRAWRSSRSVQRPPA